MTIPQDFSLDRRAARLRFGRSAPHADAGGFLAREVAQRMAERLAYIRHEPARLLDAGCGIGPDFALLGERYPKAERFGVDFALPLIQMARSERSFFQRLLGGARSTDPRLICGDVEALPLARATMQMVWSNLMLNWLADPMPAVREMHRVLEVGGMLMFSTLGPDTLKELRAAMPAGSGERVHRFIDMHDLGDCLVRAGFSEPVMDMETITLTYADLDGLLADLRRAGATNVSDARPRGLAGKGAWARARAAYEQLRQDGRLPASFEIIYGHAWKAAPKTLEDGRSVIQFKPRPGDTP
ncbi:methyltransferase domain-containing protein [Niveibacterium sp. 24ML]|uniref:methyltransferase domain-containing protein n=1 Tax=Niveibacterium sp. 24ML TaxID=2985512 RepID=UPI00226E876C|nr:methyltransferase domain-containing protein [Niveibacterium sp. 24ML]MCX9155028.1 methyltransferase domain-containing protein [Niveibacterium sp. 24ML]